MHIKNMVRLEETTRRLGGVGDNWHMTWAENGSQYLCLCDGSGWDGMPRADYNSRLYVIEGDPQDPGFRYLPGYPELVNDWKTRDCSRYYNFGVLALEGRIYQFLSTPNHPFTESEARFVGAKLIYSPDGGSTWCNQDGSSPVRWEPWEERSGDNMVFFEEPGDTFSLLTVLQMGKGYGENRDGYVYIYSPDGSTEVSMNRLVMFRVPKDLIRNRGAYEYFSGLKQGGDPKWSPDMEDRAAVHVFPSGWVNKYIHPYAWQPSVVYVPPLELYLMANWGMGCTSDGHWFGKPSYLGFWAAPKPWGPWEQVYEETAWTPEGDKGARAYQPQIVPGWIADDGLSFWLVWTDFQDVEGKGKPYYSFNTQMVRIIAG